MHLGDGKDGGLTREEMDASVATLDCLSQSLGADIVLLRERQLETGFVADFLVRKRADERDFVEVRWVGSFSVIILLQPQWP